MLLIGIAGCADSESNEVVIDQPLSLPYFNTPDFDPIWSASEGAPHYISNFRFTNQNGETVDSDTFKDKIYLTNFFFTSCGSICPKMTGNMEIVQNAFKDDSLVMFLSHSVTPEIDSTEKLKTYTTNFNVIDGKWHFVTGDKSSIYAMARQAYFAEEEPGFNKDSSEFLHTEHFVLVDRNKRIRGIYNGTVQLEMDRIVEDIRLLLTKG